MAVFIIRLENLRFKSKIGVFDFERKNGNDFEVNVRFSIPSEDFRYEDLQTTVNYAEVYRIVSEEMAVKRILLESVSQTIAERISDKWPMAFDISVKISKLTPPIPEIIGACSVEYSAKNK